MRRTAATLVHSRNPIMRDAKAWAALPTKVLRDEVDRAFPDGTSLTHTEFKEVPKCLYR